MKSVAHLTLFLDIDGLERMIGILCRGEKAAGWAPRVIVFGKESGELKPEFNREGIPVVFLPKGRRFSLSLPFRILRYLSQEKISLIHTHDICALIYGGLVRLISFGRIRVVHTQHSFLHLHERKMRIYERIFPWLANVLVCVSEDLRRTHLRLWQPFDRLRVILNGVEFFHEKTSPETRRELRRKLLAMHGLPGKLTEKKWVISLGRIAEIKGLQHALELWNGLKCEKAALILVGPDTKKDFATKLKENKVPGAYFAGPSFEPDAWLRAADCSFRLPSSKGCRSRHWKRSGWGCRCCFPAFRGTPSSRGGPLSSP